jgi:eukaryotic-like serine/threonine-protein kinase
VTTIVVTSGGTMELWVYDLDTKTQATMPTRGIPYLPRWWPDGRRVVYTETSPDPPYRRVVVRQLVESAGQRDTLGEDWEFNDVAPDTLHAVGVRRFGRGSWIVPLQKGAEPVALDTFPNAWGPTYSRDGRWIAYTSNESGQYEIYVTEASRRGERRKVSRSGGEEPRWTRQGDELIYRWGQEWFAVTAPPPGSSTFGPARTIFRGPYVNVSDRSHDISPDGRRHLVVLGQLDETTTRLNVITDWLDAVRRKVARP